MRNKNNNNSNKFLFSFLEYLRDLSGCVWLFYPVLVSVYFLNINDFNNLIEISN